ncbi:MAG TPA: methionine--tRNA ligase [Candidatus Kerfeldbacteria bacterium]|nr:methionine--tRNA ligase [Candidatus Kerfeldbacteria bacterium]
MSEKFYITTPIYYVNDKPHIGHAYTTIAADVLARFHRSKHHDVLFLTGTDEHGDKVAESAKKQGMKIDEFVDKYAGEFENTFKNLNIQHDIFMRTTMPEHDASVQIFRQKLKDADALYEGEYRGLYCRGCEDFYMEKDLVDGKCPVHNVAPEIVKEKNWFFKLESYLPQVKKLIEEGKIIIEPASRKNEVLGLFKQGLKDFSVTRERVKWGLNFPGSDQKIYVWVEALQNYISAIGYGRDDMKFKKWWPADVHLMAKDIIKFHAVYWPAMLIAAGEEPPKKIFAHGFFSLDGKKMSKSLGNVIDPNELVKKFGADATRYLLLSQFPFGQDGDIKESKFVEQYNADLANGLGNLVSRTANLIEKNNLEMRIEQSGDGHHELVEQTISEMRFDDALKLIRQKISDANKYLDERHPWKMTDATAISEVMTLLVRDILSIARALKPFMPGTSERIVTQFTAAKILKGTPLFPRIVEQAGKSARP